MASLLTESLFEISGQGPAPSKDYYHLTVTKSHVVWRWWRISLRNDCRYAKPGEQKDSHQDYLDDLQLQSRISFVFGVRILQYTRSLCQGHYDYLERLPDPLLLRILICLELEDVGQLARTSHRFRKLCGSEEFWEQTVRRRCDSISAEVWALAREVGWRTIFFTNKLQLQKLISRRRHGNKQRLEGQVCGMDTTSELSLEESPRQDPETDVENLDVELESDVSLGTSPCCGIDPVSSSEAMLGLDSGIKSLHVPGHSCGDTKRCMATSPTAVQDVPVSDLHNDAGYCSAELVEPLD